ncbi:MAG: hypothetical protein AVDCRST_MAG78-692, partial [uncultured Rubrobacteraceae bacterium]
VPLPRSEPRSAQERIPGGACPRRRDPPVRGLDGRRSRAARRLFERPRRRRRGPTHRRSPLRRNRRHARGGVRDHRGYLQVNPAPPQDARAPHGQPRRHHGAVSRRVRDLPYRSGALQAPL